MTMMAEIESEGIARGVLESLSDGALVLGVPGTDYKIQLVPTVGAASISTPVGKRIKGTIHATALRMFAAKGGGRFIEPLCGEPRIVAGTVLAAEESSRRVLVDVGVPIWMTLDERQPQTTFSTGQLVNCYLKSGTQFTPVAG